MGAARVAAENQPPSGRRRARSNEQLIGAVLAHPHERVAHVFEHLLVICGAVGEQVERDAATERDRHGRRPGIKVDCSEDCDEPKWRLKTRERATMAHADAHAAKPRN